MIATYVLKSLYRYLPVHVTVYVAYRTLTTKSLFTYNLNLVVPSPGTFRRGAGRWPEHGVPPGRPWRDRGQGGGPQQRSRGRDGGVLRPCGHLQQCWNVGPFIQSSPVPPVCACHIVSSYWLFVVWLREILLVRDKYYSSKFVVEDSDLHRSYRICNKT